MHKVQVFCLTAICILLFGCRPSESEAPNAVIVATRDLATGSEISVSDVEQHIVPDPPKDAYKRTIDIIGQMIGSPIAAGQVITSKFIDIGNEALKRQTHDGQTQVTMATQDISSGETFTPQNIEHKSVLAKSIKIKQAGDCPVFQKADAIELKAARAIKSGQIITQADVEWLHTW